MQMKEELAYIDAMEMELSQQVLEDLHASHEREMQEQLDDLDDWDDACEDRLALLCTIKRKELVQKVRCVPVARFWLDFFLPACSTLFISFQCLKSIYCKSRFESMCLTAQLSGCNWIWIRLT